MTQCTQPTIAFSSLKRKKIQADFRGGRLTSDAGALLLREVDKRLGLVDAMDAAIPDPRNPMVLTHPQRDLLAQRIFGIALGYEDLNDHTTLRHDPAVQVATGRPDQPLGSAPTLCRLENRVTRASLVKIAKGFVDQFIASFASEPDEIVLDFDATDDRVHGNQEGRFFHGYYDDYCFLPLYVFCGDQMVLPYLRPSNIDGARHTRPILKLLVNYLRKAWPKVHIVIRADSGFCRFKLMRWCEKNDVSYILGLARNRVLERMAAPWCEKSAAAFQATGDKQRLFADIQYGAQTWECTRRVIVKAEQLPQGPNVRFVVTNLPGDAQHLYDKVYCQRGEMENRIKENQLGLFADRTSCHAFVANQFRLMLSAAAYILVESLRRLGLSDTELAKAQVQTLRVKLFKIGARVVTSARRIVLHLASGYPLHKLLSQIVERLRTLHLPSFEFR